MSWSWTSSFVKVSKLKCSPCRQKLAEVSHVPIKGLSSRFVDDAGGVPLVSFGGL